MNFRTNGVRLGRWNNSLDGTTRSPTARKRRSPSLNLGRRSRQAHRLATLPKSEVVWILAGLGLILFFIQATVKMMINPKNRYEIPPVEIPGMEVKLIETGSPPGQITCGERFLAFVKPWAWHVTAAGLVFVGFAADYIHANIGKIDGKYGAWTAAAVFGATGLIRTYQFTQLTKQSDTRQTEVK